MDELFNPTSDNVQDVARINEFSETSFDNLINDALREAGESGDLSAEDAAWLESLFQEMDTPVADTVEQTSENVETEQIAREMSLSSSESFEGYQLNDAIEQWHVQDGSSSCAVCSQQFIINEFLDLGVTEAELSELAERNGWFDPEGGTALSDVGKILEYFGIETEVNYEGTIDDLVETLDQGGRVIVGVDSSLFWEGSFYGYPAFGADHAIEVIGIDRSDPQDVRVIVNDSGSPDGCGRSVPFLEFTFAWAPSGGFMVSAFPND